MNIFKKFDIDIETFNEYFKKSLIYAAHGYEEFLKQLQDEIIPDNYKFLIAFVHGIKFFDHVKKRPEEVFIEEAIEIYGLVSDFDVYSLYEIMIEKGELVDIDLNIAVIHGYVKRFKDEIVSFEVMFNKN